MRFPHPDFPHDKAFSGHITSSWQYATGAHCCMPKAVVELVNSAFEGSGFVV